MAEVPELLILYINSIYKNINTPMLTAQVPVAHAQTPICTHADILHTKNYIIINAAYAFIKSTYNSGIFKDAVYNIDKICQ